MFLVDTSVWVDLLSRKPVLGISPEQLFQICTCPPVIQELLQGLPTDARYQKLKDAVLALPCISPTINPSTFIHAGEIYRTGRRKGMTIRSSTDCLIAAIAIEHKTTIWHKDRDFDAIASFTDLHVTAGL